MAHFKIVVFFKRGALNDTELKEKVVKSLRPFNELLEAHDPYKKYFSVDEIEEIAQEYNISPNNLEEIAKKLPDWNGDMGGVDKEGLYCFTVKNRNGHFSSHREPKLLSAEDKNSIIQQKDLLSGIISPEGDWIDEHTLHSIHNEAENDGWRHHLGILFQQYEDTEALLVECLN